MIKKTRTPKAAGTKAAAVVAPKPIETSKNKMSIYLVLLAIVILTGVALMINQKIKSRQSATKSSASVAASQSEQAKKPLDKSDISALIARVGSLIVVNANEEPTIATVQDADALRQSNPVFYKDARNGDRLLVWSDKAVLYSPQMDKLLAVMPILGGQTSMILGSTTSTAANASSTASTLASEKATVEVRNGTRTAGLAKSMANLLKAEGLKMGVVGDMYQKDAKTTVIYKLTDKDMPATLAALKKVTKAEVFQVPVGNFGFKGDFVVVVGADFVKP
ncbi:MAG: LytR C-terminal domain-containing protein [Patescibacteria group bacterium]|jgi:hypothetical protein